MIAAISLKDSNKHESISTCRFAQRVAMVDNDARRNEVLDDKTVIKRLRRRVAELQTELKVAQEVARDAQGRQGSSEDHQSALASDGRTVDRNRYKLRARRLEGTLDSCFRERSSSTSSISMC
eukprot:TRINITY_DN11240_c0_g1_i2.p1 TRINITY_DN11240_c0_g1~~TRINITY_DN11240_c0_g1_i2.p1  ORF type:complete len:123 (+),score=18.13 TRINITY_DN11240_c0_g1_i2:141-509(+)